MQDVNLVRNYLITKRPVLVVEWSLQGFTSKLLLIVQYSQSIIPDRYK